MFELFEILAHGAFFASGDEPKRKGTAFPGKDGGGIEKSLRDAKAREPAEPEPVPILAQLGDRAERRAPTNGPGERTFGAERKPPVGSGPGRSTNDAGWRDRAPDQGLSA